MLLVAGIVSTPCSSLFASEYLGSFSQGGFSRDIVVNGNYGYIANGFNGLQVVDISTIGNISLVGNIMPPYVAGRSAYNLLLNNNYLYMTDRTGGLLTYDVSVSASPVLTSNLLSDNKSNTLALHDNKLFMGDVFGGLVAMDISNPSVPQEISRIKLPNDTSPMEAQGIAFKDNYALVANPWDGLAIVDITNPLDMSLAGYYHKPVGAFPGVWDVVTSGNFAFIIAQRYGIQALDISDPTKPTLVSELLTPVNYMAGNDSPPLDIKLIDGKHAVITNGYDGVYVIDISDPYQLKISEKIDTPGYAWGTRISGASLFIADGYNGIHAYDISEYKPVTAPVPVPPSLGILFVGLVALASCKKFQSQSVEV